MLEYIYEWMENIAFYMVLVTAVMHLLPDSDYQKYVRFFTGLTLVVLLLTPVSGLFGIDEELKNISQNRDYEAQMEKIREASPFLEDTGGDGDEKDSAKIQVEEIEIGQ